MKVLVVVDMQNDFIDGALGTKEAVAIVPNVAEKIKKFDGKVLFTRDTHEENYMDTQEGKNLPVPHCICGTEGWQIRPELEALCVEEIIDKPTFGSTKLGELLKAQDDALKNEEKTGIESRATILGHVQRGGSPTVRDRVIASQMGGRAVELLMEGKSNRIVCVENGKIADVDIEEGLAMKKHISQDLIDLAKKLSV